jgi:succinate dehydrogenase / fumarate reductase membrane anchor subunit
VSIKTPLKIISGLGSAKTGTIHFWHQRLTALANIPLSIFLIWFIASIAGANRLQMVVTLSNPIIATLLILSIFSILWHMRLGMQVVIEDYITTESRKILALTFNNFFVIGVGALSIISILKLGFGG